MSPTMARGRRPAALPAAAFAIALLGCDWSAPPGGAASGGAVLLLTATANVSDASLVRYGMFARENQPDGREATVLFAVPRSGELRNLFVAPSAALESPGAVVEVVVRVNRADTALAFTHTQAAGTAVFSDTTTVVPVQAGDLVSVRFAETAGVDPILSPGVFAHYNVTLELH